MKIRNMFNFLGDVTEISELKEYNSGKKRINFTIKIDESYYGYDKKYIYNMNYIDLIAWDRVAEIIAKNVKVKHEINVSGKINNNYKAFKKGIGDKFQFFVSDVEFLKGNKLLDKEKAK